jgi:hypothetical protein
MVLVPRGQARATNAARRSLQTIHYPCRKISPPVLIPPKRWPPNERKNPSQADRREPQGSRQTPGMPTQNRPATGRRNNSRDPISSRKPNSQPPNRQSATRPGFLSHYLIIPFSPPALAQNQHKSTSFPGKPSPCDTPPTQPPRPYPSTKISPVANFSSKSRESGQSGASADFAAAAAYPKPTASSCCCCPNRRNCRSGPKPSAKSPSTRPSPPMAR